MRISDWSSDVCSSDLECLRSVVLRSAGRPCYRRLRRGVCGRTRHVAVWPAARHRRRNVVFADMARIYGGPLCHTMNLSMPARLRSEEHTSELQSLMRISDAFYCLKKKKHNSVPT